MSFTNDDFFTELHLQVLKKCSESVEKDNELLIYPSTLCSTSLKNTDLDSYKALGLVVMLLENRAVFKFYVAIGLNVCICNTGAEAINKYNENKLDYSTKHKLEYIPVDVSRIGNKKYEVHIKEGLVIIHLSKNCNIGNTYYKVRVCDKILSDKIVGYNNYLEYKRLSLIMKTIKKEGNKK